MYFSLLLNSVGKNVPIRMRSSLFSIICHENSENYSALICTPLFLLVPCSPSAQSDLSPFVSLCCSVPSVLWIVVTVVLRINDFSLALRNMFCMVGFYSSTVLWKYAIAGSTISLTRAGYKAGMGPVLQTPESPALRFHVSVLPMPSFAKFDQSALDMSSSGPFHTCQ